MGEYEHFDLFLPFVGSVFEGYQIAVVGSKFRLFSLPLRTCAFNDSYEELIVFSIFRIGRYMAPLALFGMALALTEILSVAGAVIILRTDKAKMDDADEFAIAD
jgi:hypothetical protein